MSKSSDDEAPGEKTLGEYVEMGGGGKESGDSKPNQS